MNQHNTNPLEERVLVLEPHGARICSTMLEIANFLVLQCDDLLHLSSEILNGAGVALVAEETIDPSHAEVFTRVLDSQPAWSELPVLFLTQGGAESSLTVWALQTLPSVMLLDRPMQSLTLISAVRAALRNRRRQYRLRDYLDVQKELHDALHDAHEACMRSENALRERKDVLNHAGRMARLGVWDIEIFDPEDLNSNPLKWSDEVYRMFGYEPGEIKVTNELFFEHVHPKDRTKISDEVARAIAERRPYEIEHRIIRRDKETRVVLEYADIKFDEHEQPLRVVGAVQDITERKQAEEELRRAREVAEQARAAAEQANQAKDRFLAVLSHELRTHLTPVLAAVSFLTKRNELPQDVSQHLEVIRRNVALEARLIDDLLDLTRIVRGQITLERYPLHIREVLERVVEMCRPEIEAKNLHLEMTCEDELLTVNGDSSRLQQVFRNLVKNSVKFTPSGGSLHIKAFSEDGSVAVEVSDTGTGIDAEALPKIFGAFEQTDPLITRQFGGLGLGLAISKRLVEMHNGQIFAASKGTGTGATFKVLLPRHETPIERADEAEERSRPANAPRRVLLVEDHRDTILIMSRLLQASGYEVETARDVPQALHALARESFDVLISDLGLPGRTGLELIKEIREGGNPIPAVALSGYGREDDVQKSKEAGFTEHLTKPVNFDALVETLHKIAL